MKIRELLRLERLPVCQNKMFDTAAVHAVARAATCRLPKVRHQG